MAVKLRDSLEWLLLVAVIFGGGAIAQAQNDAAPSTDKQAADEPPAGKIVRIGPSGDSEISIDSATIEGESADASERPELPKHWIGILGGPVSDELRAQIDIPENQGVMVRQVVPGSPADKAGLKSFDILLKANDTNLADVRDLTSLVRSQGENGGKITLDVLRRGEHESVTLTPESRPEEVGDGSGALMGPMGPMGPGMRAWHLNPRDPLTYNFRSLPGRSRIPGSNLSQMPSGVSVSIQKQNDGPAHITVQRGNDTWTIVGDDPSSLEQLPEDVRPFVEQLLAGGGRMQMSIPTLPGMHGTPGPPAGIYNGTLQERLDRMEQQLEEMQQRMRDEIDQMRSDEAAATSRW